ncbi:hypothetical protein [Saccharicrinis aurantiacus]|uniref:hypothetical protein n=1 Tax=Saccharicrinis aurantiacus TaxID=1849719 RepID=UPI0009502A45|nr:hypothetical protein [Saccharicrinis aurantiacus]
MNTTVYYAPDAVGSPASVFTDGDYWYERVHQLGSLGALDGWLKRIGKRIKKGIKKVGKGIKKVAKKSFKILKKVSKVAGKVIRKALPIVNTALTFIPGVGWAAKAALTAVEIGLNAYDKAKARKKAKRVKAMVKKMNAKTTRLAKKAKPVSRVNKAPMTQNKKVSVTPVSLPPPQYSALDFMKINAVVNRDKVGVDDVIAIVNKQLKYNY